MRYVRHNHAASVKKVRKWSISNVGHSIGALLLADELRSDTSHTIRMLREAGVARLSLDGDEYDKG
jgi:cation transport ATPase